MPRLSDVDYHRLRSCYVQLLRKVLLESSSTFRISQLSDQNLCTRFCVPTFLTLWDQRRLMALPKLITADSPPLRSLLAACHSPLSIWSGHFASLARMQRSHASLAHLPSPSMASLSDWCNVMIGEHSNWKAMVKSHKVLDPPRRRASTGAPDHSLDPQHPELFPGEIVPVQSSDSRGDSSLLHDSTPVLPPIEHKVHPFACSFPQCTFLAKTAAGLAMHSRRKHNVQTPLSLRLRSHLCPACDLPYDTRDRALEHVKASKRCRTYVMQHIEPMLPEELRLVLDRERGKSYAWTRPVIPKPGPKPPGEKPPRNAVTPLFADADQRAAAIHID
eukprot:3278068-Amphidinium_carterae.2